MPAVKIQSIPELPSEVTSQPQFDFEPKDYYPRTKIFIAATQRSGSYLLCDLLQHNKLGVPAEYLHPTAHLPLMAYRWNLISNSHVDIEKYLKCCFKYRTTQDKIFSIKAHYVQFAQFLPTNLLQKYFGDALFIMIRRKDLLGQAISYEIASQTGQWQSFWPKKSEPKYSPENIKNKLYRIMKQNMNWYYFFARNNISYYEISYEELVSNPQKIIQNIIDYTVPHLYIKASINSEIRTSKQRNNINDKWRNRFIEQFGDWY